MTVSNLPYKLFCQQKRFSLYNVLLKNPDLTYEQFKEFLLGRSIAVPDEDYFNKVKSKALEDAPTPPPEESVEEVVPEEVVEEKPKPVKKRRGRRSASKNSN